MQRAMALPVIAVVFLAAAKFGLSLDVAEGNATPVWPPTAIALVCVLLMGPRVWPAIWLGAFVANATTPVPLWVAFAIAVGNTLEALAGYYLLERWDFRRSLERMRDVVVLVILAGGVSTLVSAAIGVTALAAGGEIGTDAYAHHLQVWWLGDAMGNILVAPALLAWANLRSFGPVRRGDLFHAAAIIASLGFVVLFLFRREDPSAAYATFPIVMWATLRFRQLGASTAVVLATAAGIAVIISGDNPFVSGDTEAVSLLQALMGLGSVASLLVAATLSERDAAIQRLETETTRLRESRQQLAEAQALAQVGSWTWDIASGKVDWSEEMFRIHGYDPATPVDFELAIKDVVPEDRDRIRLNAMAAIESGEPGELPEIEYRLMRSDGKLRLLVGRGRLIADANGPATRMVGTVQDLTERRKAEENAERLRDMEARHAQALELNDGITQGLAAAKLALELGDRERGLGLLKTTMGTARSIVSKLLRPSDIAPGDLVRSDRTDREELPPPV